MDDLSTHVLLFLVVSAVIVAISSMFSEPEDGPALKMYPRRLLKFVVGSGLVLAVMLVCEHTFASIH
ncbi:MAG: hypothetical protein R3F49_12020 [Planctomycetota bacterium]